jgi:HK97 family phage portal protein
VLPNPARIQQYKRFKLSEDPPQWFRDFVGGGTATGVNVTPDSAMRITGALACIRIIADTEASLPFFTYRRLARGKEKATEHYLYPLLHDAANPEMSAFTYRRTITAHVASRGNGLSEIEFDGAGRVKALWPLNPDKASLERDPRTKKLYYYYILPESEGGYTVRLPAERVFHIKWLSQNGLWAMSPVQLAREPIGISLAAQEFMARFFANDASPRGALETPNALSDKAYERLKTDFDDRHGGLENKHRYAILEEGLKFNPISLSPQDIMLLDLMKFGIADVGRIWGISLDMLNENDKAATYASVEQFGIRFSVHTVRPWTVNWEQEAHRSLLTESERKEYFVEHQIDGLLRGDFKTRIEGYNSAITTGWMVRNEAREYENMNPREGMDEPLVQMNMKQVSGKNQQDSDSAGQQDGDSAGQEEDGQRAREVMTPIYHDIFQRIYRRELHDIETAARKHKDGAFVDWRKQFFAEDHQRFVAMQLYPAIQAHAALIGLQLSHEGIQLRADEAAIRYCVNAMHQSSNLALVEQTVRELAERSEL